MQQAQSLLQEIAEGLGELSPDDKESYRGETAQTTAGMLWVPNPGPQTEAFFCQADELFYGGQAGGGKTDLLVGLSVTQHEKSLVLRRTNKEAKTLVERFTEVIGNDHGLNRGPPAVYRMPGRRIDIGGCQLEEDKQKYKGDPHDLKGFDEVSDFTESQYVFIIAWNRSVRPGQRCRVVACGNPPTRPEGLWIIKRWAAWLDPRHPSPAVPGELRWYTSDEEGKEIEVDGAGPHLIGGDEVMARSRTFIPAELEDNPDLAKTNYGASLDALPRELRSAYRDGKFDRALEDDPWQVIPTDWVIAAQDRWIDQVPKGIPMCALSVDVAQGGKDNTVLAARYDGYYPELITRPGSDTPEGKQIAGLVVAERRDNCVVIIDMGGGYGGDTYAILKENEIRVHAHKGSEGSTRRTLDKQLRFFNKRAEVHWQFREALDPDQDGGSHIQLPPDPEIIADLTAPTFTVERGGVKLEPKERLVKRLGRSPDKGDAIVNCWSMGDKVWNIRGGKFSKGRKPEVILGHKSMKRRR